KEGLSFCKMKSRRTKTRKGTERNYQKSVDNFKSIVLYSVLGIGTATGIILLGRRIINKSKQNKAQKSNLIKGNPSTYSTQLYMAMGNEHWYATADKVSIFNILNSIPSQSMYAKVQDSYKNDYKTNLNADLEQRLNSDEYNEAVRMISLKPKA